MATFNWPGFGIAAISPTLDQPAQVNRSAYTGVRSVASNPWHGKWSFKVQLAVKQGDANFQAIRAFFTGLQGPINNFHLPAVEQLQNANSGVTLSASASQGATSLALTGLGTALVAGNMATIAGQLLSITSAGALSGTAQTISFQPALRAAAASGASIETAKPYALVALIGSSFAWNIAQWRQYGVMFEVDEAIGDTDGASPSGDVWSGSAIAAAPVPANTALPVISGSIVVGQTLTTTNGTWTNSPTGYTYQWTRGGVNIAGATASTYTLVTADNTTNIAVVVTATNANGSATATSASVGPISSSSYAGYALAEVFTLPQYWVAGTQYTPITALPGYTFTRSGIQGAVDASGAVQFFAANVPAINSAGFHAYGALTNSVLQSQALDNASWPKASCSATADTMVAPDGTTTVDKVTTTASPATIFQSPAVSASSTYTYSIFVPKSGNSFAFMYAQINLGGVPDAANIGFNLSTGAVGTFQTLAGAGVTGTAYTVSCGSFWRLIVVFNTAAGHTAAGLYWGPSDTLNGRTFAANGDWFGWQVQNLLGNFPNGGPIIATTTAAASIGANAFTNTVANGSYSAVYTFDDNSTQTIATTIAAGVFTFPTTLNRNVVKQVLMN
jgi:hypothetical protein